MWVEVVYALPDNQVLLQLDVPEGTTLYEAALQSGITQHFEHLDLETAPMGVFGKRAKDPKTQVLEEGDRVEIYRPLLIDPKQARINRANKGTPSKTK